MAKDERTQRSLGSASIISRRRFLKQTAFATAVASVPYLAGRSAALGKEQAKSADAALDRALKELVAMEGGPPGVIAVVQRGKHREVHTFGVRNIKSGLPIRVDDRMRIARARPRPSAGPWRSPWSARTSCRYRTRSVSVCLSCRRLGGR
jgi:hypothetical protein